MQVLNPLQITKWEIKKFLLLIIAFQFIVWGLISLDAINVHIPLLRALFCFVYLTFVPGILVLRCLRQHKLGNIETILYSVGLSLAILMFTGLFLNTVLPIFGLNKPLSFFPILVSISLFVLFFSFFSYLSDKNYSNPSYIDLTNLENSLLFLILLPILSILGSQLVNYNGNTIILLVLIPIISIIPLLVFFNKIPEKFYPFTIFIIGLSLIYHTALISQYIWGLDVHSEYYLAKLVITNSYWNIGINENANSMLSIVFLAPIYVKMLGVDLTYIIKVVFTFLFAILPLGLYSLYKNVLNESVYGKKLVNKIIFLACFFLISFEFFYFNAPTGWRQEIAEIFLVLTLMVLFDRKIGSITRSLLLVIFILSLTVSHYGTSYLWMFVLLSAFIILKIKHHYNGSKTVLSSDYVLLFVVFACSWYIFTSTSSPFTSILNIGNQIFSNIFDLLNPDSSSALNIIVSDQYSLMTSIEKYMQICAQFFVGIGIFWIFFTKNKMKMNSTYLVLAILNFILLVAGVVIPYFSNQLSPWRLYHIGLIVLAPLGIIGALKIFDLLAHFMKNKNSLNSLKFVSIFFTVFLLFNTCWIYGLVDEYPQSTRAVALYQKDIKNGTDYAKNSFYASFYTDGDISGVNWFSKNRNNSILVYADHARKLTILKSYGAINDNSKSDYYKSTLTNNTKVIDGYLFMAYPNTNLGLIQGGKNGYWNNSIILDKLPKLNALYDNGDVRVYLGE